MRLIQFVVYFVMFMSRIVFALRRPVVYARAITTTGAWKVDGLPSVVVRNDKAKYFETGYPLVYVDAITKLVGNPQAGDDVLVKDSSGAAIGRGFYNPHSMFRVRMMAMKNDPQFGNELSDLISVRIKQAMALRRSLLLPKAGTDTYRLVNCEGDFLSGLIIDVLGSTVVIQSSAVWVELQRQHIESAVRTVPELADKTILWRKSEDRLQKDGLDEISKAADNGQQLHTSEGIAISDTQGTETEAQSGSVTSYVVNENGLKYSIDVITGQKTGFYCDQRDNRLYLRSLSAGKTVLDLYCYGGGFSLNALQGGAASVVAVDSSLKAMESVRENMILNGFNAKYDMTQSGIVDSKDVTDGESTSVDAAAKLCDNNHSHRGAIELMKGEAERVMKTLLEQGRQFDMVICDPPKLAPTRASLHKATRKYEKINAMAMQLVSAQGGLMLTCTCSAAMTQSGLFLAMLQHAATAAGRKITVLRTANAAPDHTVAVAYPEGRYFTSVLLYVQ